MRTSIAVKIFLGFAFVILSFGLVAGYSIYKMGHVHARLVLISNSYIPLTQALTNVHAVQQQEEELFDRAYKKGDASKINIGRLRQPRKLSDGLQRAAQIMKSGETPASLLDANILAHVNQELSALSQEAEKYMILRKEMETIVEGEQAVQNELIEKLHKKIKAFGDRLTSLSDYTEKRVRTAAEQTEAIGNQSTFAVALFSLLAILIGIGTGALAHFTLRPLSNLSKAARAIGRGEEPQQITIPAKDEIGALAREFDKMVHSLKNRDRKIREKHHELEALTRFHSDIIRSISTGIVVLGRDKLVRGINPAGLILWELNLQTVEDQPLSSLPLTNGLQASTQKMIQEEVARAMNGEEQTEPLRALPYRSQSGKEKLIDFRIVPFADATGDIEGVLLLGEDVTMEVRTKEKLLQSERLATVGRMAAQVAHEIRNPLSSIGLNAELLEDDLAHAEEGKHLLHSIQNEVDRLASITEEYLQYARLPIPQRKLTNINKLVESLCQFSLAEASTRKISLQTAFCDELPSVKLDKDQIRQSLLNLLRNAFEALSDNGGVVEVQTQCTDEMAQVSIYDNGPGILAENVSRVFEPFFSTKSGGTGLGLALTQQIIEGHGGQIHIETSPESGTRFLIELPLG